MQVSTQVGSAVGTLPGPHGADGRKGRVLQVDSALGEVLIKHPWLCNLSFLEIA